jgi:hypothetical protein
MTVREAGHPGGHKGGEVVSEKVSHIREENKKQERKAPSREENVRVHELVDRLKEENPKR